MSGVRTTALKMIEESKKYVEQLKAEIDALLEDGEDDYYREKVVYKSEQIILAEAERKAIEQLLDRAADDE